MSEENIVRAYLEREKAINEIIKTIQLYGPMGSIMNPETVFHGVDHVQRTMLYAILVGNQLLQDGVELNLKAVLHALSKHDVMRLTDDLSEPDHGADSVRYCRSQNIFQQLEDGDRALVEYLMKQHSLDAEQVRGVQNPVWQNSLNLLRDADGLEWLRDQILFDEGYLHFQQSRLFVPIAEHLINRHLYYMSAGKDAQIALMGACIEYQSHLPLSSIYSQLHQ